MAILQAMLAVCMGISLKIILSNYLLMAILQAMLAVCRGVSLKIKLSNYLLIAILQAMLAVCMGADMDMINHVINVYKNCGLKPVKTVLNVMVTASSARKQRLFYSRSFFSESERENTSISGYRIVKTDGVRLHMDMVCELHKIIEEKNPAVIYTDELRNGEFLYKPDFAPDNLEAHNYIGNCIIVREDLFDDTAGALTGGTSLWSFNRYICGKCICNNGADNRSISDKCISSNCLDEKFPGGGIAHVSRALFEDEGYVDDEPVDNEISHISHAISHDNQYTGINNAADTDIDMANETLISIIIPNYEHVDDLRRCVESLLYVNSYKNIEIIIVENNSKSDEIFAYYDEILKQQPDIVKVVKWEGSFNYSAINNYGVGFAKGELLLLLNNDTKLIEPGSLYAMARYALRENTGAVGACLLYEDKTVQHAGVIVGIGPDRTAVHPNSGVPFIEKGYRESIHHVQNYSAVTGACLMVKKVLYDRLGGLDEELAVAYNDVDFCLRLRTRGLLNVYVPQAFFFHYESRSRGYDDRGERHERFLRESALFRDRWQGIIADGDPYYNRCLSKTVPWKPELKA